MRGIIIITTIITTIIIIITVIIIIIIIIIITIIIIIHVKAKAKPPKHLSQRRGQKIVTDVFGTDYLPGIGKPRSLTDSPQL